MEQFNVNPDKNGLVLCDKYLPVEVLMMIFKIFCPLDRLDHVEPHDYADVLLRHDADYITLLSCQMVCKRWKKLIDNIWREKTKRTLGKPFFPLDDNMPLSVYCLACVNKPYERNLVRNHSGAESINHWRYSEPPMFSSAIGEYSYWTVEEPPFDMPKLPQAEPLFEDRQICFATSLQGCTKLQEIHLTDKGIHPYILDTYQPPIMVSEWYGCRRSFPAVYQLKVQLFHTDNTLMAEFQFKDVLKGKKQNQWRKVSYVFENYGRGLRRINFVHHAQTPPGDNNVMDKICKTAGSCVYVKIP